MAEELSSSGRPVVVLDIDGTLLDSAPGIVAGFQHALRSVGFPPPDESTLRRDLGPPVDQIFTALGLPADRLPTAVQAYRRYYLEKGLRQSRPYPGVPELLASLQGAQVTLATATAKRTNLAEAILDHHGMRSFFAVVAGTDDLHVTKTQTLEHVLDQLGRPDPADVAMVGDRHSDIAAARACGVLPVAVSWGYGSTEELSRLAATTLARPQDLLRLPLLASLAHSG